VSTGYNETKTTKSCKHKAYPNQTVVLRKKIITFVSQLQDIKKKQKRLKQQQGAQL